MPSSGLRAAIADRLFEDVLRRLDVRVELPGGRTSGSGGPGAPVLVLHRPHDFARRVGASGLIGFGESYMAGDWDAPDLAGVLAVFAGQMASLVPARLQAFRRLAVKALPSAHLGSQANTRRNISAHYDLSNEMFELFLDPSMSYSSALFDPSTDPDDDAQALAAAQERKIERLLDVAGVRAGSSRPRDRHRLGRARPARCTPRRPGAHDHPVGRAGAAGPSTGWPRPDCPTSCRWRCATTATPQASSTPWCRSR